MKTSEFDYELPQELIAQEPLEPRDSSRLMVVRRREGKIEHRRFRDILEYLRPGDVLVANDSRVIPARLYARKIPTGGKVELLLIARREGNIWETLVRGRRVRPGAKLELLRPGELPSGLFGRVLSESQAGGRLIEFSSPLEEHLNGLGLVPLPPYIHKPLSDPERYQTVYARVKGSVAAPTAGLHFTPNLMEELKARGIEFAFITLHIGLDTFRPIHTEELEDHPINRENCHLSPSAAARLNRARAEGSRIVAVGTTSVRVLETAARAAQDDEEAVAPFTGWTDLFIYPGFRFRAVDALITNFHLPRSTLLALVAAFSGKELILRAYREAIENGYRFYSFGDAMFIF